MEASTKKVNAKAKVTTTLQKDIATYKEKEYSLSKCIKVFCTHVDFTNSRIEYSEKYKVDLCDTKICIDLVRSIDYATKSNMYRVETVAKKIKTAAYKNYMSRRKEAKIAYNNAIANI